MAFLVGVVQNSIGLGRRKTQKSFSQWKTSSSVVLQLTADWDGCGLLKEEKINDVPVDTITYNFAHLTIQEFLCAVYMSTLSDQEQEQYMLSEH